MIDYAPLSTPIAPQEVAAWKAAAKARGVKWDRGRTGLIVGGVMLGVFGLILLLPIGGLAASFAGTNPESAGALGAVGFGFFLLCAVPIGILFIVMIRKADGNWERWMRLDRFAQRNGMVFSPMDAEPQYPGAIFRRGGSAVDHMLSAQGRFFDMGNYQYVVSNGKNSYTVTWGFMAFKLDRRLPHMVMDSKSNNSVFGSNLPASFDRSQVLSLEGDFDRWFTLYCPAQYERDALYVFTPDLMALLIDEAAPFDVEVIDDWMFVYSSRAFTMTWPGLYERLFRILNTVGNKTLTQTDRYQDDRVAAPFVANIVAPPGTRLRSGLPRGLVAVLIVVGVMLVLPVVLFLGGFLIYALGS
jgi:hypothetical protein